MNIAAFTNRLRPPAGSGSGLGLSRLIAVSTVGLLAITPGGAALAEITIATAGPMSGQYAVFGANMRAGAEQAVADINAAGGVLGQKLRLEIGDDACDPKRAVAVANQMAGRGIAFMAGHFCSGSSIPASEVYAEQNIVQISPASTHPKLTDERPGPGVMRVCGRDDQQGLVAGEFLASEFGDMNVAIVHDNSTYGKGLADQTQKSMNAAGKVETLYDVYTPGERDYGILVSRLKAARIDALYVGGSYPEASLIVRHMREEGMDTVLISGDDLVTDRFWSLTGEAGEGTLMTFSPDPLKNPQAAEVIAAFEAKGVVPEFPLLYTYATIQAWAQAAEAAGSVDFEPIVEALNSGTFDTVLGEFSFDHKGDASLPGYIFYKWSQGIYDHL